MHKNTTKCNKTQSKWCINKHGASKIIDTFETYHQTVLGVEEKIMEKLSEEKGSAGIRRVSSKAGESLEGI
jgi:hypothetical protein